MVGVVLVVWSRVCLFVSFVSVSDCFSDSVDLDSVLLFGWASCVCWLLGDCLFVFILVLFLVAIDVAFGGGFDYTL